MSNLCDPAQAVKPGPLTVLPDRYIPGVDDPGDPIDRLGEAVDIATAFDTSWDTDAHFTQYWLHDERLAEPVAVRWNRPSLPKVRQLGGDLLAQVIGIDLDNEGHEPWTEERWQDFLGVLTAHQLAGWSRPLEASCFYTTRNGMRFVYLLDQPVKVDELPKLAMGLVQEFRQHGLMADELKDWTRLFRLPKVNRDGGRTEKDPFFQYLPAWDRVTRKDSIVPWLEGLPSIEVEVESSERPSSAEVNRMLRVEEGGQLRDSQWFKDAKKTLRAAGGRPYSIVAENQPIAQQGERDTTLQKVLGQAVGLLFRTDKDFSKEQVYALFYEPLLGLEPDAGTPDWHERGWRLIEEFWQREVVKKRDEIILTATQEAEAEEDKRDLITRIADGMMEWCDAPELRGSEEDRARFVLGRLFVGDRTSPSGYCGRYFLLLPTGYYSAKPVIAAGLFDTMIKLQGDAAGLVALIGGLHKEVHGGRVVAKTVPEITQGHTVYPTQFRSTYTGYGRMIFDIAIEDGMEMTTAHLPMFWKNPRLRPEFNADVHGLLMAMAGGDESQANALCAAIAWSLDFTRPSAGLFLHGPAACGKTLIARGLSECMDNPGTAGKQAFQRFNGTSLKTSPFIWIDEGWPEARHVQHNIAHTFRQLVGGGGAIELEEKGKDSESVDFSWRVVVTSNNDSVLRELINSVQTPADRKALAERSFDFKISQMATDYLAERGGFKLTKGWIDSPSCRSKYTVAQHFLWLYENRYQLREPGPKFGFTGDTSPERLAAMTRTSPAESMVSEILLDLLNVATPTASFPHAAITEDGLVACRLSDVDRYYRANFHGKQGIRLNTQTIQAALAALAPDGTEGKSARRPVIPWDGSPPVLAHRGMGVRTWAICPKRLYEFACTYGHSCPPLERYIETVK